MEFCVKLLSLPLWERGLKCHVSAYPDALSLVAPLVGAWIEMFRRLSGQGSGTVAPLVGAWIEILRFHSTRTPEQVAPLVGAWIEINAS